MSKCKRMIQCMLGIVMMCGVSGAPEASESPEAPEASEAESSTWKENAKSFANLMTNKTNQCYINITKAYIACIIGNGEANSNEISPEIITKAIEYFNKDCETEYDEGSAAGQKISEHIKKHFNGENDFVGLLDSLRRMLTFLESYTNRTIGNRAIFGIGRSKDGKHTLSLKSDMKMEYFISRKTSAIKGEYLTAEGKLNPEAMDKITEILLKNWYMEFRTDFIEKISQSLADQVAGSRRTEYIKNTSELGWNDQICRIIHDRALHSRMLFLQEYMNDIDICAMSEYKFWEQLKEKDSAVFNEYKHIMMLYKNNKQHDGNEREALRSAIEIYPRIIKYCLDCELTESKRSKSEGGTDQHKYERALANNDTIKKMRSIIEKEFSSRKSSKNDGYIDHDAFISEWRKFFKTNPVTLTPTETTK